MNIVQVHRELTRKAMEHAARAARLGPSAEGKVAAHVADAYEDAADLVGAAILEAVMKK